MKKVCLLIRQKNASWKSSSDKRIIDSVDIALPLAMYIQSKDPETTVYMLNQEGSRRELQAGHIFQSWLIFHEHQL